MTSPADLIAVRCPKCGHDYQAPYRASVNRTLDPDLDVPLGATCPKCGEFVAFNVLEVDWDDR